MKILQKLFCDFKENYLKIFIFREMYCYLMLLAVIPILVQCKSSLDCKIFYYYFFFNYNLLIYENML